MQETKFPIGENVNVIGGEKLRRGGFRFGVKIMGLYKGS